MPPAFSVRAASSAALVIEAAAYPVSGHSPEDPVHQANIDQRYVEWLAQYLK